MAICQICHQREASLFFTRSVNGQKTNIQVCKQCATENGIIKIDLNKLLAGLAGFVQGEHEVEEVLTCEHCGMTLEEFNSTGLMGCSHCYETFAEPLEVLLHRIHGHVKHTGKRPLKEHLSEESPEETLKHLKAELSAAISEEAYERAAEIRDHIRLIEKQMGVS